MRIFKAILSVALALAAHGVHAATGPAAAELITSDASTVNYETPENFLLQFQRIQNGTVYDLEYSVKDVSEVEEVFASLSGIITAKEAMLNAMKALVNVEVLHETDTWLGKRIDALEKSAKAALAKVDKTEVVDKHGNQIESILKIIEKPESGSETIEVTTEGTPVDDMSLSFTGKPKGPKTPAPLEIKGFSDVVGLNWLIPHPKGSALAWDSLLELLDLKTIDSTSDSTRSFGIRLGLKGWDAPQAGAAKCDDQLSSQLLTGDKTHYVLTKLGDALHYTPVGKLAVMSPDGKSVVTNETADGSASVAGAAGATQGFVPYSDGNGGFAWDYATPTVAWDDSTDTLTVTTPREDDETKTVVFPRISVEKEDGEDSTTYTVTWRDLNGEQTEETEISVPKASAVSPDGESVVTNDGSVAVYGWKSNKSTKYAVPHTGGDVLAWRGFGDFFESATFDWTAGTGKVAPKGYGSGTGNKHYFGTGPEGGVGWWELPNVTTNYVQSDEKSITSTTDGDTKTLGLKGWDANYGGSEPRYAANVGGEIVYREIPAPAPPDGASLASNAQHKIEIKGWNTANGCSEKLSVLLSDSNEGTQRGMHQLVTRYGTGDNAVIHYLPIGDALPKPPEPDGKTVTTNNTGTLHLVGADSALSDMVAFSDGSDGISWDYMEPYAWFDYDEDALAFTPYDPNGGDDEYVYLPHISVETDEDEDGTTYTITWRNLGDTTDTETVITVPNATNATGAVAVDGTTIVTNAPNHAGEIALKGFWDSDARDGYFPVKVGGALVWMPTNVVSVTTNKVDGDKITITSTEANGEKTLGLKDWNANYSGKFPLFLVNDGGALGYYPLPEQTTNRLDDASISSNAQHEIEIKGFATGTPRCHADLYSMLTNTATAYPEKSKHLLLSRYEGGSGGPETHWIPFPAGALEAGAKIDNETIGLNSESKMEVKGYEDAHHGTVPCVWYWPDRVLPEQDTQWFEWRPLPIADSNYGTESGGLSVYTRTIEHSDRHWVQVGDKISNMRTLVLYGFEEAKDGTFPIRETPSGSSGSSESRRIPQITWTTGGNFPYSDGKIGAGAVTVGRQAYKVNESGTAASSGSWRVKVVLSMSGGDPTITVESGDGFAAPSSTTTSYFPLYELDGSGNVVHDWRGTFVVPAYEQGGYW